MPLGIWAWAKTLQCEAVVLDGITNKPVQVTPTYSIVSGAATANPAARSPAEVPPEPSTVRAVATGSRVLYQFRGYSIL